MRGRECEMCGGPADSDTVGYAHGVCVACYRRMLDVPDMTPDEFDRLPFGIILLDRLGRVTRYNKVEQSLSGLTEGEVVGRDFFAEIAPCTDVRAFRGRFEELLSGRMAAKRFRFVFRFPSGEVPVTIVMVAHSTDRVVVAVQAGPRRRQGRGGRRRAGGML